ncbi:hypothetical protein GCM10009682_35650 [Luedemannella flava]|uniref:MarR family transcriptional regulator n=1 Tax=Luedemannella flava TaxID=349316 RepID=A0ABP4YFN2_9ACTN
MATTTRRTRKNTATTPAVTTDAPTTPDETVVVTDATATDETTPATPDETLPATDTTAPDTDAPATSDTDATATDETTPTTDADAPVSGAPVSGAPVSGAPVSGAPVGSSDHLKIVMVAGILGDHPDGVTASAIVDESGLRAAIVGRVLAAMETAGAAVRKTTDPDSDEPDTSGTELWVRGEAELTTVDLSAAAVRVVCPTCQRPMPRRNTVTVNRTGPTGPGLNSDGSRTLGKNELRNIVRDFLWSHPGHEFTPTTLSREIGRSSGAVANALAKLVVSGEAVLVREVPATFAAPEGAHAPATADQ